jgi:hypothetical protein
MKGMPKWLNSKEDVFNCMELAIEGQLDKRELKKKLQDLLSDEKVYKFSKIVNEGYTSAANERVCEVKKEDGSVEYHCYVLQDNPDARYVQMGFSKEEIQSLIRELE